MVSSNLQRGFGTGSPADIMSALHNRHNPDKAPGGSLSYENSSPTSPPPSRLKPKYAGSPTVGVMKRQPSLVEAAKQQVLSGKDLKAAKWQTKFPSVPLEQIKVIIARAPDGNDGLIHRMLSAEKGKAITASSQITATKSSSSTLVSSVPIHASSSITISDFESTPRQSKKVSTSKIYKNRTKTRRRDPDESSAEEASASGSEADWSGDDGRKKKKRKTDDGEIDAEGAALKAFNEETADVLTGTIGEFALGEAN